MEKTRAYDIVQRPILTEKSYTLMGEGKYTFEVSKDSNKLEIKEAIEILFNVKVIAVRTMNFRGKPKRLGRNEGYRKSWKKAIVKLADGYVIKELQGNM